MRTILCFALALLASFSPTTAAPLTVHINARVETLNGKLRGVFETDNPNPAVPHIGDAVPARVGERLKVSLIGIDTDACPRAEVPVPASFTVQKVGMSPANITFLKVASNSNSVVVDFIAPGAAHLDFEAYAGHDYYAYKIERWYTKGSIAFTVGDFPNGYDEDRWLRSLDLNKMLYRAILEQGASGANARVNADLIYKQGLQGVLTVAKVLADFAEERGLWHSKGYNTDHYRVAGLYCALLHRKTPRADFDLDPGYHENGPCSWL